MKKIRFAYKHSGIIVVVVVVAYPILLNSTTQNESGVSLMHKDSARKHKMSSLYEVYTN